MYYKILLTIDLDEVSQANKEILREALLGLNWQQLDKLSSSWSTVKVATDVLTAKFKVEKDLTSCVKNNENIRLSYAFQLSLGEITAGKLIK